MVETEFVGSADPLPASWSRGASDYRLDIESKVIRHALGYSRFIDFVSSEEPEIDVSAWVPSDVVAFIARHGSVISSEEDLVTASAIYLGNVVIKSAPAAHWEVFGGSPEVSLGERGIDIRGIVTLAAGGQPEAGKGIEIFLWP